MASKVQSISQRKRDIHVLRKDSMMNLPRSLHEAYKLHLFRTQHPAMKMFGSSIQAHRSCNEAILFLYGISGAGKSATLNHLFDSDLIPTSDSKSCTDSVTEWVSTFASEHWKVSNLEVGFIDVPGWGDSLGRDAANFSLIQHFLAIHPILGSKIRKFYPNIVLLVFNSNDNRMFGDGARAHKMLQTLSKLNIVDKEHPNVVIVLTHVCSHPAEEFEDILRKLGVRYQTLSYSCLGVSPPVVWLENHPGYRLEKSGVWTLLHDATAQPLNLYNAIIKLMEDAGDELGKEAIRLYFKNRASNPLTVRLIVNSTNIDSKLRSKLEDRWRWEISRKTPIHPKSTQLTTYLCKYIVTNSDLKLKESDIQGLLLALNCSTSFHDVESIEGKPLSFVQDQLLPYPLTVDEKVLLVKALKLEIPDIPQCLKYLSSGYNVLKEEICSHAAIFEFSKSQYFDSFLNCLVSKSLTICPYNSNRMTFGTLNEDMPSKIVEINEKLKEMSLILNVNIKSFFSLIEIVNILPLFWVETGMFMAQLNFPHLTLSKEFCDAIDSLPQLSLDETGVKKEFLDLFEKYGHFAIIKAAGGGLIEGKLKTEQVPTSPAEYISRVESMLDLYINLILEGNDWKQFKKELSADDVLVLEELDSAPLLWFAGDQKFTSKTIEEISKESYSNWLNSLKSSSVFFDYSFNLVPIHLLAQTVKPEAANQVKIAFESLLNEENTGQYYCKDDIDLKCLGSELVKVNIPLEPIGSPTKTSGSRALSRHKKIAVETEVLDPSQTKFTSLMSSDRHTISENNKTDINSVKVTCFPADSYVELKNGNHIRMKELQIGDYVLSLDSRTGRSVYSKVFMWGHFDPDLSATFIEIHHEEGVLRISENHLLMHGRDRSFTTAANIKEGDTVHHFQKSDRSLETYRLSEIVVESINRCELIGVYAPFTHNSLLVVDGLVCSAFGIPDTSISQFQLFEKMSRICMSPICLMDRVGLAQKLKNPLNDTTKIHWYAEALLRFYHLFPFNAFF